MKKLVLSFSFIALIFGANAQQIDVNSIFMTESGVQDPSQQLTPNELESEAQVTLWFNFTNNLNNDLLPDDSITFGWEINGVSQGNLIQSSRQNTLAVGASVNSFLQQTYTLPEEGTFEICVWPLYNPYDPNTDEMTGRTCQTFEIEEEEDEDPNSIAEHIAKSMKLYAGQNEVVIESGEADGLTHVAIFDLSGKMVFNRNIQLSSQSIERINVNMLNAGMYIVRLSQGNNVLKANKVVLR